MRNPAPQTGQGDGVDLPAGELLFGTNLPYIHAFDDARSRKEERVQFCTVRIGKLLHPLLCPETRLCVPFPRLSRRPMLAQTGCVTRGGRLCVARG